MKRVNGVVPASRKGQSARCNDCKAVLIWAVTERGARMPIDAQLNIAGNLVLCYEVDALERPVSAQLVVNVPEGYEGPRWLSHFATCPKASTWRRGRAVRGEL